MTTRQDTNQSQWILQITNGCTCCTFSCCCFFLVLTKANQCQRWCVSGVASSAAHLTSQWLLANLQSVLTSGKHSRGSTPSICDLFCFFNLDCLRAGGECQCAAWKWKDPLQGAPTNVTGRDNRKREKEKLLHCGSQLAYRCCIFLSAEEFPARNAIPHLHLHEGGCEIWAHCRKSRNWV